MIAELISYDSSRWGEGRIEQIERSHDVRSVEVTLAESDGEQYPRLSISTPSCYSSVGMREDGPVRLELFDEQAHDARGSAVCGPDERWVRTVVDADLRRSLDEFVRFESVEYDTLGDVLTEALERFHDAEVDSE